MSNPHFTFPPPPPPPPQPSGDYNRVPQFSSGQRGSHDRGRGAGRGHGDRGRGFNRGGARGGNTSSYGGYPPADHRQTDGQYGQSNMYGSNYPPPNYPPVQQPHYPANAHNTYNQPHPQRSQQYPYPNSQPSYSGYSGSGPQFTPVHGAQPPNQRYGHNSPLPRPHQPHHTSSQGQASQPIVMPPIRVGRDGRGGILRTQAAPSNTLAHFNQGPPVYNSYQQPPPTSFQQKRYDAPNPYQNTRGRGHNRGQSDAFKNQRHQRPSGQVAPAVPSFGNPLPGDLSSRPPPQGSPGDVIKKPKKKKRRRHNQLGLTPKTEEHESSSEEEDDQDEEMKLAAAANAASQQIQFEYKGQTSTLNSSSEIAAWIAERRKRFPTKARAEEAAERKKQNEEARRVARQAAKDSQEKRRIEARERQEKQKVEAKQKQEKQKAAAKPKQEKSNGTEAAASARSGDKDAAALKARLKVEKLRKRLEREEKRIAKAEAKSSRKTDEIKASTDLSNQDQAPTSKKRKRTDSLASSVNGVERPGDAIAGVYPTESAQNIDTPTLRIEVDMLSSDESRIAKDAAIGPIRTDKQASDTAHNPLTPTSQPSIPDIGRSTPQIGLLEDSIEVSVMNADSSGDGAVEEANISDNESSLSLSDTSSDISSDSESDLDSTSSSGSSSSSSSDSDAAPEIAPSKPLNPPRVPPPKRQKAKSDKDICRQYLKSGRCPRGEQCNYRHELPEKGSMSRSERKAEREAKAQATGGKKRERKGLYQRLVEQEKDEEDRRILTTIIQMGEKGLLSAPSEKKDGGE